MKKLLSVMFALAALSLLAPSSGVAQDYNLLGIFNVPNPTLTNNEEAEHWEPLAGPFEVYAVCINPFNDETTQAPISVLGGYEFHLVMPAEFQIFSVTLPQDVINFASQPTFFCSGLVDVVDGQALLATLQIATFTGTDGLIYMEPVPTSPSIPDNVAITDGGDNFQLVTAYPVTLDFALPVFGIHQDVIPSEDESWSDLKALYR